MTDDSNTAIATSEIDEDVLTHTVSDEELEAAAGERGALTPTWSCKFDPICP
jgi:hypothetical protein